jgi:hypothetical protein
MGYPQDSQAARLARQLQMEILENAHYPGDGKYSGIGIIIGSMFSLAFWGMLAFAIFS